MFGDGITRDLEPTVEDGGAMWRLFESCMRVFRSGAARCTDRAEACCKRGADDPESDCEPPRYRCRLGCILLKTAAMSLLTGVNVWSLTKPDAEGGSADHMLVSRPEERASLAQQGWLEVCSPAGGASAFCGFGSGMAPTAALYEQGPFLMYHGALGGGLSAPCHRCVTPAGKHFVSTDEGCLGKGTRVRSRDRFGASCLPLLSFGSQRRTRCSGTPPSVGARRRPARCGCARRRAGGWCTAWTRRAPARPSST